MSKPLGLINNYGVLAAEAALVSVVEIVLFPDAGRFTIGACDCSCCT